MHTNSEEEDRAGPKPGSITFNLQQAENHAIAIAKLIRANRGRIEELYGLASVDDALALADDVAKLAAYGRRQESVQATIAEALVVEYLDLLIKAVDTFSMSTI